MIKLDHFITVEQAAMIVVVAPTAKLSGKPHSIGFAFEEGEPLVLEVLYLQAVESFTDQLLTVVNLSLVEHEDTGK